MLKTNEGGLWALPQMLEVRRRGHEIVFVIPAGTGKLRRELDSHNVPVVESAFDFSFRPSLAMVKGLLGLRRQLAALNADVIFYHLLASALAVRLVTFGSRQRRVHMVAGPLYLDSIWIRSVERILCLFDDVLIAGSEYTAERYKKLGMPATRVRTVPYGVDLTRFNPERVSPEPSVDTSKFNVIMVAYFYAPKKSVYPGIGIKGHEVLLTAWESFAESHPEVQLILVGAGFDDSGEAHRQKLMQLRGDAPTVRWVETVDDVRPWYVASQLSVSPSLSENHGAALEASAMSCPSVVSDAGGLPETVVHGDTGWIVEAASPAALEGALSTAYESWDRGKLDKMGTRARQLMVRHFDQRECTARVVDVLLDRDGDFGHD